MPIERKGWSTQSDQTSCSVGLPTTFTFLILVVRHVFSISSSRLWRLIYSIVDYPIVPSFQEWEFPHDHIPALWSSTPPLPSLADRCIITNTSYANEDAHTIPREEAAWFARNSMSQYVSEVVSTESSKNLVKMRVDLHTCFDRRRFAIVPKPRNLSRAPPSHAFVLHVTDSNQELTHLFHNVEVRLGRKSCREYFFARFAWTVLLLVKPFVTSGLKRHVVRFRTINGELSRTTEWLGASELTASYSAGGSARSASPKKRRTENDGSVGDEEDIVTPYEYDDDRRASQERWYEDNVVAPREEEEMGRKRRRRSSIPSRLAVQLPSNLDGAYDGWSLVET